MRLFQKGDIAKCHMTYSENNHSEWTGEMAMILECFEDYSPFTTEKDAQFLAMVKTTQEKYNMHIASNVKYKVMIGRRIVFMNHLCFVEKNNFVDWKVAFVESGLFY